MRLNKALPKDIAIDNINIESDLKKQVDAGLRELDEGKGIPHEEIEKRMSRWLRDS